MMLTDNNQIFRNCFVIVYCHLTKVSSQINNWIIFEPNELSITLSTLCFDFVGYNYITVYQLAAHDLVVRRPRTTHEKITWNCVIYILIYFVCWINILLDEKLPKRCFANCFQQITTPSRVATLGLLGTIWYCDKTLLDVEYLLLPAVFICNNI